MTRKSVASKALIIGGGGFIGSNLTRTLLADGRSVRVLELPNRNRMQIIPDHPQLEWCEGNFTNARDLRHALVGVQSVFHLASTTIPESSNENPQFDVQSNLLGTVALLEEMRRLPNVPVIFASSGGTVYGRPKVVPIAEEHSTEPECSYGIVKLTIEKYLALYRRMHGTPYRVLRMANPYGPGQEINRVQGAIGVLLSRVLSGQPVEIWGDGSVVRDYFYVSDAISALKRAEAYVGDDYVFNIGSGKGHSLLDILAAIEGITHRKCEVRFTAARSFDVPTNVLNIGRAQTVLGWRPEIPLEVGLRHMVDWLAKTGRVSGRTPPLDVNRGPG
jgi:UDP-glucose 4-epimerase